MGNACCVSAKAKTVSSITSSEDLHHHVRHSPSWSFRRDSHARHSPSWSFRRDNRRVAGEIDNLSVYPCDGTTVQDGICRIEDKSGMGTERGNISDAGTPPDNILTPTSLKSPGYTGLVTSSLTPSDASFRSNHFAAGNNSIESPEISEAVALNLHSSLSSPSSLVTSHGGPSASHSQLFAPSSTPACRQTRRSPGHQLFRQISDSRILGLKSPNSNSSEGRPSFVLSGSTFTQDLAVGSLGGGGSFCDGWSLQTFSELVASSQRERLSFDSDHFDSGRYKINDSSSRFSYSSSGDLRACGACSKLLSETERATFIADEVAVVAVLVCGHAYHADCLEKITPETTRYDPCCPICTVGEKQTAKMSKKALKAEAEIKMKFHKKLKNRVMDSYFGSDLSTCEFGKRGILRGGKSCKTGASSSTSSKISFGKPFLKKHFSIGSKWIRAISENDLAKKKGFWSRHR